MNVIIKKWGKTQGIRLSKRNLDSMGISVNDEVKAEYNEDYILIRKNNSCKTIYDLFKNYEVKSFESELILEDNNSLGNELW